MFKLSTPLTGSTSGAFKAYIITWATILISLILVYFYLSRRRYVFTRTLATSKNCKDILATLTKEFSGRYHIPWTHFTQLQIARAPYNSPAASFKYDVIKVSAHNNHDDFFHVAIPTDFMNLVEKQMCPEHDIDMNIVLILLPFGATHYSRPIRRLLNEVEKCGIPAVCLLDRNTKGYEYPYNCEPLRNSYLDHTDSYLLIEFLTEALCLKLITKEQGISSTDINQRLLLDYAALRSNPFSDQLNHRRYDKLLSMKLRFHFVGYSLGAMQISYVLADRDMHKLLADIVQRVGNRYQSIKLSVTVASASCGYATFDIQAILDQPKYIQRMLAKHLIQELTENAEKREYLMKHLAAKVANPAETMERAISSGLLSDLDAHLSCALYEFETYVDYYKELIPTGKIHMFHPDIPVLFLNTADDFITGKNLYFDVLERHPQVIAIVINKGGHLGTILRNGDDLSSKIIAQWVDTHRKDI